MTEFSVEIKSNFEGYEKKVSQEKENPVSIIAYLQFPHILLIKNILL